LPQKNLEAAMELVQLSMTSSQRMIELQANLARQLFEDGMAQTKAQLEVKDPQQLLGLRSKYAQETAQHMIEAGRKVAELSNETRGELTRLLGQQLAGGSEEMAQSLQSALQGLPGGAGPMAEVMKTAMTNAQGALEQMAQVSQSLMGNLTNMAGAAGSSPKKK
jgi:phasin family protein